MQRLRHGRDGRTLLASGGDDGTVRLWLLTARPSRRTAPALMLAPASRHDGPMRGATRADPGRRDAASLFTQEPPTQHPVPEFDTEHVATLVASRRGGWAAVLPDGSSYKCAGDVSDVLWWAIKLCRFEVGELDPYDSTLHLPHPQPIL